MGRLRTHINVHIEDGEMIIIIIMFLHYMDKYTHNNTSHHTKEEISVLV